MKKITALSLLSLGVALTLSHCGKQDSGGGESSQLSGDQKSSHFETVHQHLDLGGLLYAYIDVDSDLSNLAKSIGEMVAGMAEAAGGADEMPSFLTRPDNWAQLVEELGLDSLKAAGLSSYRDGDLFHNKVFLHFPEGREGIFKVLGGEPRPFLTHAMAPADSDIVFEREIDLNAGYEAILKTVSHFPELASYMLEMAKEPMEIPGLSMTTGEFIQRLDTRMILILRIDPDATMPIPMPGEFPMVEALVGFEDMGWLFDSLKASMPIDRQPGFESETNGDEEWIIVPDEMQSAKFRPAFYIDRKEDLVLFGTHRGFIEECLGDGAKVGTSDDFKSAMKGLPEEGNGLSYMTPAVMKTIREVIEKSFSSIGGGMRSSTASIAMLDLWLPQFESPIGDVSVNLENGVLGASNSYQSHKSTLLMTANPTMLAILTSMGVPAYSQARVQAEQTRDMSVVRQLSLGCRAYAADNDGNFPPNLKTLVEEQYFDAPELLIWTNPDSGDSGEYLYTPGLNDTSYSRMVLIASPEPVNGKRIVGYVGGQVLSVPDFQYQQEKAETDARLKKEP